MKELKELHDSRYELKPCNGASSGKTLPVVVIAGRPNVGKSTLFNRLVQRKVAITSAESGTTRDGAVAVADFCGEKATLVDTGGYRLSATGGTNEAEIDSAVRSKAKEACKKADTVILLLEAGEATAEDEEIIHFLRPMMEKTVVAVNKTEGGRMASASYEWARFGFGQMLFVSAEHGDNIDKLKETVAAALQKTRGTHCTATAVAANIPQSDGREQEEKGEGDSAIEQKDTPLRLTLVGKPNTGKSTLLNRLTHSTLSIVSPVAGTTRDSVLGAFAFEGTLFSVLDTAGIRRKSRVKEDIEYYSVNRAIKSLDECDIAVILIDAGEGITGQDKKICDRALDAGRAVIFALSKWDTQNKGRKAARDAEEEVRIAFPQMAYCPIVEISAIEGTGIIELLRTAKKLKEQLQKRIETSALNIALHDWTEHRPPAGSTSGKFKIRYMTQIGVNPPRFVLFARDSHSAPKTYLTYLKNSIRRDMGFCLVPVVLEVRESSKRKSNEDTACRPLAAPHCYRGGKKQ